MKAVVQGMQNNCSPDPSIGVSTQGNVNEVIVDRSKKKMMW